MSPLDASSVSALTVSRGKAVIFFRRREEPFEPAIHWVFAEDIDATYEELRSSGAKIVEPLEKKPWGLSADVREITGVTPSFFCRSQPFEPRNLRRLARGSAVVHQLLAFARFRKAQANACPLVATARVQQPKNRRPGTTGIHP